MRFSNRKLPATSPEALAILASWLDDPCHLAQPQTSLILGESESLNFLVSVSETLNSDCESSSRFESSDFGETLEIARSGPKSNIVIELQKPKGGHQLPSHLDHKSIDILLTEYYKLVAVSKNDQAQITANRYQPTMFDSLINTLTMVPPEIIQINSLTREAILTSTHISKLIIKFCPIILALWLSLLYSLHLKSLASLPIISLYFILGVLMFLIAEKLCHNEILREQEASIVIHSFKPCAEKITNQQNYFYQNIVQLQKSINDPLNNVSFAKEGVSSVREDTLAQSVSAKSYHCSSSMESHLTNPPHNNNMGSTDLEDLQEELKVIKLMVLGEEYIPNPLSTNAVVVKELQKEIIKVCTTVGVDCTPVSICNTENIRTKLTEIKELVGC